MSESIIKCFGIPVYTEVLSDNTVSFIHQEVSEAMNTTMFLKPGVQKLNEKSGQLGHIISSKLLSEFTNKQYNLKYFIALEPDSTFG